MHLKSFFGQKLIVERQELAHVATLHKLGQIQNHFDGLGHVAVAQSQLQIVDQVVLFAFVDLDPYAYETSVEQIGRGCFVRNDRTCSQRADRRLLNHCLLRLRVCR